MSRIAAVDIQRFNLPLAEVLSDAKHGDHTHFELITATVRLEDGSEGTGYTYTGGRGGRAIEALLVHDLAPFVTGRDAADVEAVHDAMQWHVHYVARGGIASFAISAIGGGGSDGGGAGGAGAGPVLDGARRVRGAREQDVPARAQQLRRCWG